MSDEVLHTLSACCSLAGMQVASRVGILWAVVDLVPDETTQGSLQQLGPLSPTFTSLVMAWSLVEIIRYGFFAAKVCHACVAGTSCPGRRMQCTASPGLLMPECCNLTSWPLLVDIS